MMAVRQAAKLTSCHAIQPERQRPTSDDLPGEAELRRVMAVWCERGEFVSLIGHIMMHRIVIGAPSPSR
jgi:hypothetical protein